LRSTLALLLTCLAVACTSTYLQTAPPRDLFAEHRPTSIQIGRKDGRVVMLLDPILARDTVWGRGAQDTTGSRSGVAVGDIGWAMAQGKRLDWSKTGFGVILPGLFLALGAALGGLFGRL
jgi:hypothetical protein